MQSSKNAPTNLHCFLCGKIKNACLQRIDGCEILQSKKTIKSLLVYLAKSIKMQLEVPQNANVCQLCLINLIDYDSMVVKLLAAQQHLIKLIEKSIKGEWNDPGAADSISVDSDNNITAADVVDTQCDEEEISLPDIDLTNEMDDLDDNFDNDEEFIPMDADFNENDEDKNATLPKFACHHCSRMFNSQTDRNKHMQVDHEIKSIKCNICGVSARSEEYLELHMNLHEGKTEKECRYCSKRYSRRSHVVRHMHKHWDKKKYQCEKCGLRFSEHSLLYNHKMLHEAEDQPIICSICNQSFKTKKTYSRHVIRHREDRPRYKCQVCEKSFADNYTLKVHRRVHNDVAVETEEKPSCAPEIKKGFTCIICGLNSTNKEQHNQHMQKEHDVVN